MQDIKLAHKTSAAKIFSYLAPMFETIGVAQISFHGGGEWIIEKIVTIFKIGSKFVLLNFHCR